MINLLLTLIIPLTLAHFPTPTLEQMEEAAEKARLEELEKLRKSQPRIDICEEEDRYHDGFCDRDCSTRDIDCDREPEDDVCDEEGYYEDGECHLQCRRFDPDCSAEYPELATDPCRLLGLYSDAVCDEFCLSPDPDCNTVVVETEDICKADELYGDGVCDTECFEPDPDCLLDDPLKNLEEVQCPPDRPVRCSSFDSAPTSAEASVGRQDDRGPTCVQTAQDCIPFPGSPDDTENDCPAHRPVKCLDGACAINQQACGTVPKKRTDGFQNDPLSPGSVDLIGEVITSFDSDLDDSRVSSFVQTLLESDEHLSKVTLGENSATIEYRRRAFLFLALPLRYTYSLTVTEDSLDIQTPWWLFLAIDDADDTTASIEFAISPYQSTLQKTQRGEAVWRKMIEVIIETLGS